MAEVELVGRRAVGRWNGTGERVAPEGPGRVPERVPDREQRAGGSPARKPAVEAEGSLERRPMEVLFQRYFKSAGPRTYAAQVTRASNGNHGLVLIEGKRDKATDEVRKHRLYIWSEDFDAFFRMVEEMAAFARAHPAPPRTPRPGGRYAGKGGASEKWAARQATAVTRAADGAEKGPNQPRVHQGPQARAERFGAPASRRIMPAARSF